MGLAGSALALFLSPPQVYRWDGENAPGWAKRFADAPPYELIRDLAAQLGLDDDYALFGSLIAPSFLLIGIAALLALGRAGRWARIVAVLTILGTPITLIGYLEHNGDAPWRYLSGMEMLLLLVIGLCAVPAAIVARRRDRLHGWRAVLLGCTLLVLVGSGLVFAYLPHGAMVGYGLEVALLAMPLRSAPPDQATPAAPVTRAAVPPRR